MVYKSCFAGCSCELDDVRQELHYTRASAHDMLMQQNTELTDAQRALADTCSLVPAMHDELERRLEAAEQSENGAGSADVTLDNQSNLNTSQVRNRLLQCSAYLVDINHFAFFLAICQFSTWHNAKQIVTWSHISTYVNFCRLTLLTAAINRSVLNQPPVA